MPFLSSYQIRFMHERLRTHAESVAFFGGGAREKMVSNFKFCFFFLLMLEKGKQEVPRFWLGNGYSYEI